MIVTPLAPSDITHNTVTVKIECSPRRALTRGVFSINQSDLLIKQDVWIWIPVSLYSRICNSLHILKIRAEVDYCTSACNGLQKLVCKFLKRDMMKPGVKHLQISKSV